MYNPYSLEGKTILVTGASSGIGRRTAIECSRMGATLVITGRNQERLNDTLLNLEGEGHLIFASDLTTDSSMQVLIEKLPPLNGVFFCAGVTDTTPAKFIDEEKIERVFSINIKSPMLLTKWLFKKKKIQAGASLVYMSSYGAEVVTPGLGIYAASKGAVNSFMRTIATEFSSRKIRANSIMAMMVKTELVDTLGSFSKEDFEKDEAKYPLGYGKPEDIAFAAIFLLSDASKWITGSVIKMDGGSTLV